MVVIYEYKIAGDGSGIIKTAYEAQECTGAAGGVYYRIKKQKHGFSVFERDLDKAGRNIVYSLEDNYDKFCDEIIKAYKESNDVYEKRLAERKRILDNLLKEQKERYKTF